MIFLHRRGFRTFHRGRAASQRVAGPIDTNILFKDRQGVSARILVQLQTFDNFSTSVNVICVSITT